MNLPHRCSIRSAGLSARPGGDICQHTKFESATQLESGTQLGLPGLQSFDKSGMSGTVPWLHPVLVYVIPPQCQRAAVYALR